MAYTDFSPTDPTWLQARVELADVLSYIAKEHQDMSKLKLFISYAWDTEELQAMLKELKKIFVSCGIPANNVFLDITGQMRGNLKETMESSLAEADRVLLISTKQYRTRMEVEGSGVHVEFSHINKLCELEQKPPSFILPLMFDGFEFLPKPCRDNLAYNCTTTAKFLNQIISILRDVYPALAADQVFEEKATVYDLKMKLSFKTEEEKKPAEAGSHPLDGKTFIMKNAWSGQTDKYVSFKGDTFEMRAIYDNKSDAMTLKFKATEQPNTYNLLNTYGNENWWVSFTDKGKWLKAYYHEKDAMPIKFVPMPDLGPGKYAMKNVWSGQNTWISFTDDGKWLRAIYDEKDAMPVKLVPV